MYRCIVIDVWRCKIVGKVYWTSINLVPQKLAWIHRRNRDSILELTEVGTDDMLTVFSV